MPYLMFKKPRSLQFFRIHELSLCVLCFGITLVRVRHNPKSSALQTPAAPLTPCLPASDALLLCQTTVICDWAPIDRTTALSPAEINAVTSSLLPGSMSTPLKPDGSRVICFSLLRPRLAKGHGTSDPFVQVVFQLLKQFMSIAVTHQTPASDGWPEIGIHLKVRKKEKKR